MRNQEIITICQQLKQEGKEPTVAMIKARLGKPLAMPSVIAGLKEWRANPNIKFEPSSKEQAPESAPTISLEQRVNALEQEVLTLKAIIMKLQAESE